MKRVLYGVIASLALPHLAVAQSSSLTAADTEAINKLTASYFQALGACDANGFADLFVPNTGYFASGFRGQMAGRQGLIGLVESERHCTQPAAAQAAARPGSNNTRTVQLKVTPVGGVQGTLDLGANVGHYEDQYVKTPAGWRIAARTVVTTAEANAGLSATDFAAINALGSPSPGNNTVVRDGASRLMSVGVVIRVADGKVSGRAYQADGAIFDDVYERAATGQWRIQSRTAAKVGAVLGTGTFTSFVENMDRSLAFYQDALGMNVPALPESGQRPYNPTNVQLYTMFDIQGAKERHQTASVPGTNVRLEMMEIQNVPHQTVKMRIQDPGIVTPILIVKDIDALLANVKKAKGSVFTPGGKPVRFADGSRSLLIRDVDGRFIELRQPAVVPAVESLPASGIVGMRLSVAVEDLDRTLAVYRDLFKFSVENAVAADPALRQLTGLRGLDAKRAIATGPGGALVLEFVDYKGVDRKAQKMRIQDRGAARLQLRSENVDELVGVMKTAGLQIHSENGVAAPIPPNFKGVLVADPNSFFLTPFAPCTGCAPTLQSTKH
ncbi:MAG: nuclear transport factor 2 family protein [Steroidobacteraceae bacterium]